MKIKHFILTLLLCWFSQLIAQDSAWSFNAKTTVSGYIETFYAYDFSEPRSGVRQPFLFNFNRHNEFNINLALVKLSVAHTKYRANLALQTGTYARDNYVNEPHIIRAINEANVGISLNSKNNLWLDAGVFSSHLGFESAIGMDNLSLSRSLCAENSPYFLSGAKLTYSPSAKLDLTALVSNGWQRIYRLKGNTLPGLGTQVNFRPSEKLTLNWSTFVGTDDPDATRRMRYFNNFYAVWALSNKFKLITGFDIGLQQRARRSERFENWYTPVAIAQYQFKPKWAATGRVEYFKDAQNLIIASSGSPSAGFSTLSSSLNLDYKPMDRIVCRIESRMFYDENPIYLTHVSPRTLNFTRYNFTLLASLAVRL